MAIDEPLPSHMLSDQEPEPAPEPGLADWWVWGMRKVAGVVAELLTTAVALGPIFILFKLIIWAMTQQRGELYQAAGGVLAMIGAFALGRLLGRFAAVRGYPDLDRWPWRPIGR